METYSIVTDFGGVTPNIGQLHNEIIANVNIIKTLYGVSQYNDVVDIQFDLTLSGPEKTELDSIVSSHVPVYIPATPNKLNIVTRTNPVKNSSYTRVGTEIFLGSTYATAKAISWMESGITSYDIEIFDKDNHQILLTANLTNTEESVQDLGTLSNLPTSPIQIEISVRKNGGSNKDKVYVESVIICYN